MPIRLSLYEASPVHVLRQSSNTRQDHFRMLSFKVSFATAKGQVCFGGILSSCPEVLRHSGCLSKVLPSTLSQTGRKLQLKQSCPKAAVSCCCLPICRSSCWPMLRPAQNRRGRKAQTDRVSRGPCIMATVIPATNWPGYQRQGLNKKRMRNGGQGTRAGDQVSEAHGHEKVHVLDVALKPQDISGEAWGSCKERVACQLMVVRKSN